jgi:predicted amidophosphoribosyltransferase
MRNNRHVVRVCRHCQAPMASGAATCWRCGVEWAQEAQPPTTLRLVSPGRVVSRRPAAEAATRYVATAAARA